MLKNYWKIAWRSLWKERAYGLTNLLGLAVGIASVILILLFIHHESGFDRFHPAGDRIFRVLRVAHEPSGDRMIGVTSAPFGPALRTDFPADVEETARVLVNEGLMTVGDRSFFEKRVHYAEANFFSFFGFTLAKGNPEMALAHPNSVVITDEMAIKYFGESDPIGKVIRFEDRLDMTVTGIVKRPLPSSHLEFDFLVPLSLLADRPWFKMWWANNVFTYVRLADGNRRKDLEKLFPNFMDKYFGSDFKRTGSRMDLTLEPIREIYLSKETSYDLVRHGDKATLYIFLAVSMSILGIAALNFMNLSTARSAGRARETGVRKVMGAGRMDLIARFMGESLIMVMMATLLGLLIVELTLPWLSVFVEKDLRWPSEPVVLAGGIVVFVLLLGLGAGMYPALFLSSFQPTAVLKGAMTGTRKRVFWKGLVVVQFSVSVILIVSTMTIQRQMQFVGDKNLGFEATQAVVIPVNNRFIRDQRYALADRLRTVDGIEAVTLASGEPGGFHDRFAFDIVGRTGEFVRMRTVYSDFDYAKTLGLKIIHGRDFSRDFATDSLGILLNQKAVETLGWTPEAALGREMRINLVDDRLRKVIGVVEDYHFSSLKENIEPLAISIRPDHRQIIVKVRTDDIPNVVGAIEKHWREITPKYPFEYTFLDDRFARLYSNETKQRAVLSVFSVLAIAIACLGLLGLASFAAERRTKEIGIRKVLGAGVPSLVWLFANEFVRLVLWSVAIALPIAYYFMNRWLEDFAYRTSVGGFVLAGAAIAALVVTVGTVSYQAIRTANANPVKSLRYE